MASLYVRHAQVVAVLVAVAVVVGWGATAVDAHGDHDIKNFHRSRGSLYGGGALEAAHHQMPTTDRALVEHVPPSGSPPPQPHYVRVALLRQPRAHYHCVRLHGAAIVMPENATEEEIWLMAGTTSERHCSAHCDRPTIDMLTRVVVLECR
jgi:hypothetical protein